MTRNKNKKNLIPRDFTIYDSANASKPVKMFRKSVPVLKPITKEMEAMELVTWDKEPFDVLDDDIDMLAKSITDINRQIAKKKKKAKLERQQKRKAGMEYPETLFYLLSKYIHAEDISSFARINKACYAVTKSKAFWMLQHKKHCEDHPRLPARFRTQSLKAYGLRQTVIRALYYTHPKFSRWVYQKYGHPTQLEGWTCDNVWYSRGLKYWRVYFKFRKQQQHNSPTRMGKDKIEELGRVDANPEEGAQVLMVACKGFDRIPALQGMTLTSFKIALYDANSQTIYLGFNRSCYSEQILSPECGILLDSVVKTIICDWWHPNYPHSGNIIPRQDGSTLLSKNFFSDEESD